MTPQTLPASRCARDTDVEMPQLVLPQHANVHGSALGGMLLHWIDIAAALVADRDSRRPVVTAAIDEMAFHGPILIGELALIHARITSVDRSSMEIRVEVESENPLTGDRRHTSTAFVTFVAIDPATRRPTPVPSLILDTDEERAEHERALARRQLRLERRASSQSASHR